ncbi:hypothetical protein RBG61_08805 [Paludicola sp. MB14-C6]|uniref:DUF7305 domain-containing protein n=1 Tax=Paludihabitans sp. MB14-C6 TaxID=3070656 RepID=UPI0027DBCF32|nr:hypothetical protein [Paludicola sp. MB14-C6]WMJ22099.1 hypothetical protein RBG61_08805 [Paludicola sp. MB14-C6]
MANVTHILSSKKGSSLVVVIVVFTIVIVLGTSILSVASYSYHNSIYYHQKQQAELTARSVMDSVLAQLENTATCAPISQKLQSNPGTAIEAKVDGVIVNGVTDNNMGCADVTMQFDAATKKVKIVVLAKVNDVSSKLQVLLKQEDSMIDPTKFVLFSTYNSLLGRGITINGNVLFSGSTHINSSIINGNLLNVGGFMMSNSTLNGYATVKNSYSNIMMSSSKINGKFFTDLTIASSGYGSSNFPINSVNPPITTPSAIKESFGMTESEVGIDDAIAPEIRTIGQNYITFVPYTYANLYDGTRIDYLNQEVLLVNGTLIDFKDSHNKGNVNFGNGYKANFDNKTFITKEKNIFDFKVNKLFFNNADGSVKASVSMSNYICGEKSFSLNDVCISSDGSYMIKPKRLTDLASTHNITSSCAIKRNITGTNIIDTTSGDIKIFADDGMSFAANSKLKIVGPNNVYIFLGNKPVPAGEATVQVENNSYIGEISGEDPANPEKTQTQLYIIGADNMTMDLSGTARFKGVAYFPGQFSNYQERGAIACSNFKIQGSIVAGSVTLTNGNRYQYVPNKKDPFFISALRRDKYFMKVDPNKASWVVDKYGK